ncbi:MAG: cytochrome c biogenesis protein CcsA, partial [Methanocellales archaeon]|nr:cytochrome c biogenesis protein CcsA [Methanocellales archaeon]
MNVGEILIRLSFLLCAAATGYAVWHYLSGKASLRNLSRKTELGCLITTTLSILLLTYYLYSVDLRYVYVFHQSSMDLAWYYRISALLAGIRGSWLFWTWCLLLMLGLMQHTGPSKVLRNAKIMDITRTVTLVIASLFLLLLIIRNPFELSVDVYGIVPTYGMGMNPLLRTPWMLIHPPLFFIGYAAFTIPYAASIGYLILEDSRWVHIAETWSRIAWFFLTLGIGIGGLWAYEVLGWAAWYWSWDPVETSSLVPWVASTAYLHAQFRLKRKEYQFVTPLLAIVTFILVIFATFIVRSGLW